MGGGQGMSYGRDRRDHGATRCRGFESRLPPHFPRLISRPQLYLRRGTPPDVAGPAEPTASRSTGTLFGRDAPCQPHISEGERRDHREWVPIPEQTVNLPRMNEEAQPNDKAVPGRRAGLGLECRQVLHHEAGARRRAVRTILDGSPRPGGKVSAHGRVAGRPGPALPASCARAELRRAPGLSPSSLHRSSGRLRQLHDDPREPLPGPNGPHRVGEGRNEPAARRQATAALLKTPA